MADKYMVINNLKMSNLERLATAWSVRIPMRARKRQSKRLRSCDIVCTHALKYTYAWVQDKCLLEYHGASRAGKYYGCLLWSQFHKVPVLHNADIVFCFWVNIDERWKPGPALLSRYPMGFSLFVVLLSGVIRTASDWVIFVYDAVMMQQKLFSRWNAKRCSSRSGRKLCQIESANL